MTASTGAPAREFDKRRALALVVAFGIVSLFADAAYEGMRGIAGPFLASLGASGAAVGIIAGTGELAGYVLRLFSGGVADRTRAYWPITLGGYVMQMAAVPALALAGNWWVAALLIIAERAGKAMRAPARDVMLSRAGEQVGQGWAFGLHEALDQLGAIAGPLIVAGILALHRDYRLAFLWLGVPAALTLISVFATRVRFGEAGRLRPHEAEDKQDKRLARAYWFYAAGAGLVAFGFADFTLVAFHFAKAHVVGAAFVPLFYAVAMASDGVASLLFGRWFDRAGLWVLIPGTLLGVAVAPLCFFGGFYAALGGTLLWGIGLGVQETVMPAAVAALVPVGTRAHAYGVFATIFGIAWFAGSAALGALYDVSLPALVALSVAAQLAALMPLVTAVRLARP